MAEQLTKGAPDFSKLFGVSFIENELAVASIGSTSAHLAAQGTDLFFIKTKRAQRNDAEDVVEEINGVQSYVVNGEYRITADVCISKDEWDKLLEYKAFSCGSAYLYFMNDQSCYLPDDFTTPVNALGLPLNMVSVPKHPLFTDGAVAATFKIQFNIEAELIDSIVYTDLDAPVALLG